MISDDGVIDEPFDYSRSLEVLTAARRECHGSVSGCKWLTFFADYGFGDLAKFLRDPMVRSIVNELIRLAGGNKLDTLFARAANIRSLEPGDEDNGPAVVTLVVNNLDRFVDWFVSPGQSSVRTLHGSFVPGWVEANTTVIVYRKVESKYPIGVTKILHAHLPPIGPSEYDLTDLVLDLPESAVKWDSVPAHRVYRHVLTSGVIGNCLDIRDGRQIKKKPVEVFREVFGDGKVWLWKSAALNNVGQIIVPFLSVIAGNVQMRWHIFCVGEDDEPCLELKDCTAPRFAN